MDKCRSNAKGYQYLQMPTNSENIPYEKMEEDLTCPVCLELYADPLMMPCSHSVCKACLRDIMKSRERSGKQDLECPACRETHNFSMDKMNLLPKNLALENIVFRYQEIRSLSLSRAAQLASPPPTSQLQPDMSNSPACSPSHEKSYREQDSVFDESVEERFPCGMCEETEKYEAEWFCPQCQVLYCQVCLDTFHPRRGSLLKHKVQRPINMEGSSNILFCHDHSNEVASIFCDTCKVVACHLCVCMGHGGHCSHTILDLETAKKQLQETVETAQEKLSALLASMFDRETDMNTHLQNSMRTEECARNVILSQYNCMMSDITDTLNIAKRKSLETIAALSSCHSSHLSSGSGHIKALLSRCEDLNVACRSFLGMEDETSGSSENQSANSSFSSSSRKCNEENIQFNKHQKSVSMVASRHLSEGSTLPSSQPRDVKRTPNRHSTDGSSLSDGQHCDGSRYSAHSSASSRRHSNNEVKLQEVHLTNVVSGAPIIEAKSSLSVESPAEDGSTVSRKSTNISPKAKTSTAALELVSADDRGDIRGRNIGKSHASLIKLPNLKQNSKSLSQSKSHHQSDRKSQGLKYNDPIPNDGKNMSEVGYSQQNLSTLLPQMCVTDPPQKSPGDEHGSECAQDRREQSLALEESPNVICEVLHKGQLVNKTYRKNELLLRADEVGPVLEQVSALSKQVDQEQSNRKKSLDASNKDFKQSIDSCVLGFHASTLHLINSMTAQLPAECPFIIPSVRSVSVVSPHQELSTPRVQSRVLMTWGFNSTTFTADPISSCAQWTVNINRNTSHIGDVKSGYLFGVGISSKSLNSKDQVGMSSDSHAIVCINGGLAMCHDKQSSPIMPLSDLPMSVTISVNYSPDKCLYMTYKIRVNGLSKCLQGRRVISLPPDGQKPCKAGDCNVFANVGNIEADTDDRHNQGCDESPKSQAPIGNLQDDRRFETSKSNQGDEILSPNNFDKICMSQEDMSLSSFSIFPVFTVSQRVKMQFPQTSQV